MPKLTCNNWECGVVVPVRSGAATQGSKAAENTSPDDRLDVFKGVVPIPMKCPGESYGDKKPWFYLQMIEQ